jgi:hypothetical protein
MDLNSVISELRELNEPVPKPMRLPTEEEVNKVEAELGIHFHPDYRKYLLSASDVVYGTLEPCTITPDGGHTDLLEVARTAWTELDVPKKLLPICEDNGDYYCMNKSGRIVFWSGDGQSDEEWPDLATWIKEVWMDSTSL